MSYSASVIALTVMPIGVLLFHRRVVRHKHARTLLLLWKFRDSNLVPPGGRSGDLLLRLVIGRQREARIPGGADGSINPLVCPDARARGRQPSPCCIAR